ncbi:unnamed protein product [Trifolium pratense]|uniref:Uncharacterized protein n=1 Tax=Trifolium pratense TaxID=57577 RepID=A0ACB0IZE8_TRIPR|nr:unnamed protein product [Trifolium pratense]
MSLSRTCSHCGHTSRECSKCGHNSQTSNDGGEHSIMLFGVKITIATNNNNNLSQHQQTTAQVSISTDASTVSDNVHASTGSSKYKRSAWTDEEHKLFLKGLKHIGKGNWKEISRRYVKTRTPTQVASHAQKHCLRHSNQNRRRYRKPSVFDLTTDTEVESSTIMEDEQIQQETVVPLPPPTPIAYPSTQSCGSPANSPLPIVLGQVALPVWPLSWVNFDDKVFFFR